MAGSQSAAAQSTASNIDQLFRQSRNKSNGGDAGHRGVCHEIKAGNLETLHQLVTGLIASYFILEPLDS
jgi:hypothetical protein